MRLLDALRVVKNPRLVLVGAGGKTTTLFRLARELQPPVIVTATTHLATDQLSLADHLILVERPKDLATLAGHQIQGVTLITGPETEDDRMQGVEAEILESILNLANSQEYPLLIEADGSRKLPLKAPADHEPAIPVLGSLGAAQSWLDAVIVVAGLSGLGKPLTSDWVHRPERFAELSGLDIGAKITPDALGRVLTHPSGGLKNIPANARRVLLLNQADTLDLQAQAQRVILRGSSVASLLSSYNAVIIASIKSDHIYAVHESVAGIVLAAGESSRFGEPKQLLSWHGEPFIRHVARKALTAGLSPVIVVTGAHSSQVKRAVEDLEVVVVQNHSWKEGQSTSIKTGLEALPHEVGAAIFLLADQPQIPIELLFKLVETHAGEHSPVIVPQVDGQRANPVLFDRVIFPDLHRLQGDTGGRQLFSKYPITWIPWHDYTALMDVDSPEDYQQFLELA